MKFFLVLLLLFSSLSAKTPVKKSFAREAREGIEKVLSNREKQGRVGIDLYSCKTKRHLYKKNSDELFRVGDQQKIVTSIAALSILGPRFCFVTRLSSIGQVEGTVLRGDLYLEGAGDPLFSYEQLLELFRAAKRKGIEAVEGNLYVDRISLDQGSLERALSDVGIRVAKVLEQKGQEGLLLIAENRSAPLEEIVAYERLPCEALFKKFGELKEGVSAKEVMEEFFEREVKLPKGSFCFVDGEGISPLSRISPGSLVSILSWIPRNFPCREQFLSLRKGSAVTGSSIMGTVETKEGEKVIAVLFCEDFFLPHQLEAEILQLVSSLVRVKTSAL